MATFALGTFTLGTLIVIVLGVLLKHSLAIRRTNRQNFNVAAIDFKKAFDSTLYHIERGQHEVDVIQDTFATHAEAFMNFSHHLHGGKLNDFEKAWRKYKDWYDIRCNRTTSEILFPELNSKYMNMKDISVLPLITDLLKSAKRRRFF